MRLQTFWPVFGVLCFAARLSPAADPIVAPGSKPEVLQDSGAGEGPAWHPELGLLTSGNGHIMRRDRDGNVIQRFTPDFYLPQYDLYIEITTLNQKLVTKKNRKVRRLRELYPGVNCKIFYQRDYLSLVSKYGLEDVSG